MSEKLIGAVLAAAMMAGATANAATVLITGANKGIGLEFAKQYAERGWTVVATARRPDEATELNALAAGHKSVTVEKLDVVDLQSVGALATKYKGKPIDVLINNAGVLGNVKEQAIGSFNREVFRQIMDTNVYGTMAVTEALLENVKASDQKKVVVLTSQAGSISLASFGGGILFYRMSKAAVNMAMQTLKADTKGQGIIFASVAPGLVETDMERQLAKDMQGTPSFQMPKPISPAESIAGMIKVIDGLTLQNSAKAFSYTGENIPF